MSKNKPTPISLSLSQSKLERKENGNLEIKITIPQEIIAKAYQKALQKMSESAKIKGFRPGKAPTAMAEKALGKEKIYQEMAKTLLTDVYLEAIKTHKIIPIVNPKLDLVSAEEGKDWQVTAVTAEIPEIILGDYKEKIKKELAAEKIWVPGKDKTEEKKEESIEKKLQKTLQTLIRDIKMKIPQILIEQEAARMLSQLIDQTTKLGLTVEQYLTSVGKNTDQLRAEYEKQAEESIKLELILSEIANQENIKIEDEEIEKMIQATTSKNIKKPLETPRQKTYLRQILRKRKAIDILLSL